MLVLGFTILGNVGSFALEEYIILNKAKGYIGPTRVLDQHTTKEFKLQAITPINHNTSM